MTAVVVLGCAACVTVFCVVRIRTIRATRAHFVVGLVAAVVAWMAYVRRPEYPVELLGDVLALAAAVLGGWIGKALAESV